MAQNDKSADSERKQTTPTGVEIPVPKREDFLRDLKKVAPKSSTASSKRSAPPDSDRP
jgi:hypothetical protein